MRVIETQNGAYGILFQPGSALMDVAGPKFFEAASSGAELIYADHAVRFPDGRIKLVRKPDWSPDTLLSVNYIEGPIAVRLELLPDEAESVFRSPAGRYELLLLLAERANGLMHVPECLAVSNAEPPCKSLVPIRRAIRRRRLRASVEPGEISGSFVMRYAVPTATRVSCIVYGGEDVQSIRRTLESIAIQSCWPHMELVVADSSGEIETEKERYYAVLAQNKAAIVVRTPGDAGIAKALSASAARSSGEALLFLPAGTRLMAYDTIERMLEFALQPHVCAVGGVYTQRNALIQGIVHNVPALADGPMMTGRECYYASGGFDETFSEEGFIRAYSLIRAGRRRYSVITPYAQFLPAQERRKRVPDETNEIRLRDLEWYENWNKRKQ